MSYLVNNAHFIFIHVPITMLIFSFVFDVLALVFKKKEWHSAGMLCLVVGMFGAMAAVATGPEGERNLLLPQHELYGKLTMLLSIVLVVVRLGILWRKHRDIGNHFAYLLAALVVVGLVSYTGHLGGKMVHPPKGERSGNFIPGGQFDRGGADNGEGGPRSFPRGQRQGGATQGQGAAQQ